MGWTLRAHEASKRYKQLLDPFYSILTFVLNYYVRKLPTEQRLNSLHHASICEANFHSIQFTNGSPQLRHFCVRPTSQTMCRSHATEYVTRYLQEELLSPLHRQSDPPADEPWQCPALESHLLKPLSHEAFNIPATSHTYRLNSTEALSLFLHSVSW